MRNDRRLRSAPGAHHLGETDTRDIPRSRRWHCFASQKIGEPQSRMALLCGSAEISLSLRAQTGSEMVNKGLIRANLLSESLVSG